MNTGFDSAIDFVLKMEGGYSVDPNDHGGETNFGISKRSYPSLDIKNLTVEQAKEIYRRDYWQECKCDELPSPLDMAMFDGAVNQGAGAAKRMLQIALNVVVDGIIGEKTIAAAFKSGPAELEKFMAQRMARYIRTVMNDPTQQGFTENWSSRLMSLAQIVFAYAADSIKGESK